MRVWSILGLCLVVGGCGSSDAISPPQQSQLPPSMKVAYTGFFANVGLVVLNTSTHVQRTISDSTNEVVWSPDGSKLAYARVKATQQGAQVLYVWNEATGQSVQLDSTPVTTLCDNHGCYVYLHPYKPSWSPDSRQIAYAVGSEIRILGADGASRRVVTLPAGTNLQSVKWTPDGRFISYVDYSTSPMAIMGVSAVSGGAPTKLVQTSNAINEFAWSPDSKRVVVTTDADISVYAGNVRIGSSAIAPLSPVWSPDGSRVAFYRADEYPSDIYSVDAKGSGLRRVTFGNANGWGLSWTSDGTMLAFGSFALFFADARGGAVYKLVDDVDVFSITHP